jgi:hypothetical protein
MSDSEAVRSNCVICLLTGEKKIDYRRSGTEICQTYVGSESGTKSRIPAFTIRIRLRIWIQFQIWIRFQNLDPVRIRIRICNGMRMFVVVIQ